MVLFKQDRIVRDARCFITGFTNHQGTPKGQRGEYMAHMTREAVGKSYTASKSYHCFPSDLPADAGLKLRE